MVKFIFSTALAFVFLVHIPCWAGPAISIGPKWQVSSLKAERGQPSHNYFGVGGDLALGYSAFNVFDMFAYGSYVPSTLKNTKLEEDAADFSYGAQLGFRFASEIYIGVRGGYYFHQLIHQELDSETDGRWSGAGGSILVGAMSELSKESYWQVCLELGRAELRRDDTQVLSEEEKEVDKLLDTFGVTLTYVFLSKASRLSNSFFGNFLNSLGR